MRKISLFCRKVHRYLTIPFVLLTLLVMIFTRGLPVNELFFRLQRVVMFGLTLTGLCMYIYPYYVKKAKKKGDYPVLK